MSRSDPEITVECSGNCGDSIMVGLTALAQNSYDERHVDAQLKREGWVSSGNDDFCPSCAKDQELT